MNTVYNGIQLRFYNEQKMARHPTSLSCSISEFVPKSILVYDRMGN